MSHDTRKELHDRSSKITKDVTNRIRRKSENNEKRKKRRSGRQSDKGRFLGVSQDTRKELQDRSSKIKKDVSY